MEPTKFLINIKNKTFKEEDYYFCAGDVFRGKSVSSSPANAKSISDPVGVIVNGKCMRKKRAGIDLYIVALNQYRSGCSSIEV